MAEHAPLNGGNQESGSPESCSNTPSSGGLFSRSFIGLVVTQFLGAMNDNTFRWLVVGIGKHYMRVEADQEQQVALAIGLACLTFPFVLLTAPAGFLSDRFSKRSVTVLCKVAEIMIMVSGVAAILFGNIYLLFGVLFLMGCQSAIFSPAKYGCIPEIVRSDRISAANGIIGLSTVLAIIAGAIAGNFLFDLTTIDSETLAPGQYRWWISAMVLVGTAVLGTACSLLIRRLRPANPTKRFNINMATQTFRDVATLWSNRPLLMAAFGVTFFWSVGALLQINIDQLGVEVLRLEQKQVGPLLAALSLGIGAGSVLAGYLSKGRIELGMVPFGAAGVAGCSLLMCLIPQATVDSGMAEPLTAPYFAACFSLFLLGCSGGIYNVPLQSYLQDRSPRKTRGSILAAVNFLTCSGMFLVSGLYWLMTGPMGFSADRVFLAAGVFTIPVVCCAVALLTRPTTRFISRLISRLMYRIRVQGVENLPKESGALLIPNHVSWADGPLVGLSCPRYVRFVVYAEYFNHWSTRWFGYVANVIPITPGKRSVVESIRTARAALRSGEIVGIFPEGNVSLDGSMQAFRPGFLSAIKHTDAPVIPVYVDGLWGSIFSRKGGKLFWKWPKRIFDPVTVRFGKPIHRPENAEQVRRAVQRLGEEVMADKQQEEMNLPRKFLRMCRANRLRIKVADSRGDELSGAALMTRTLVVRRLLRREVLADDEQHVGLLLPPSAGAVVVNAAMAIDRRIAVNLNYSMSSDEINSHIRQCGIRHVLTSRRVMEKLDHLDLDAELVYLEDLKEKLTLADKLAAAAGAWLIPVGILERRLGLTEIDPDDVLTVIFTSGTTGNAKGVMLSHRNVGSNVAAFNSAIQLHKSDTVIGILPMFHSFGYTANLWLALTLAPRVAFHFSPLEARAIGKLCKKHSATIIISTPTFLRSYLRKCEKDDFASLDVVITGAERLPPDLIDAFEKKFGVRPTEGYGTTELSPVVGINVPDNRRRGTEAVGLREGSIGRPLPGISAKTVDVDTGEDLGVDQPGLLLIKGPSVMKGYLDLPDKTAEVIHDGWYTTGDIAKIDADGFIHITDRLSRFSKIGGEMVPHVRIEDEIVKALGLNGETAQLAIAAVPDQRKGERLVVLHTGLEETPQEICRRLAESGLPPLWIPSPANFRRIDEIPILGTGKIDLKGIKEAALREFAT